MKEKKKDGYVCVQLLCGLPGSGKSTVVRSIVKYFSSEDGDVTRQKDGLKVSFDKVVLIDYDALAREETQRLEKKQDNDPIIKIQQEEREQSLFDNVELEAWRQTRVLAVKRLVQELNDYEKGSRVLIIMDDNFSLRSMRREIFQVCQKRVTPNDDSITIGLSILYVDTPLPVCLERNAIRGLSTRVPDDVIQRMAQTLEPPEPSHAQSYWEASFTRLSHPWDQSKMIESLKDCIHHSLVSNPVVPKAPTKTPEQLEKERNETFNSRYHRFDLLLRTLVRYACQTDPKKYASVANAARKQILQSFKKEQKSNNNNTNNQPLEFDDLSILDQFQTLLVNKQHSEEQNNLITKAIEMAYQSFLENDKSSKQIP